MLENGFIRLPRRVNELGIFDKPEHLSVYVYLLTNVRFRESEMCGVRVGVNQYLCSKSCLAESLGLTLGRLRSILDFLKRKGVISTENVRNKYTLITLLPPYVMAQENSGKTQSGMLCLGTFCNVLMTEEEYKDFCALTGKASAYIEKFSAYLENHPEKRYKSHYAQLRSHYYEDEKAKDRSAQGMSGKKVYDESSFLTSKPSYDLERAIKRAETGVPKVKKREKRPGVPYAVMNSPPEQEVKLTPKE